MNEIYISFIKNVLIGDTCWEWAGRLSPQNYGRFRFGGREYSAHRLSWQIENGSIPDGMYICHHCDNPKCVRPTHLFCGTPIENQLDAYNKNRRSQSGEHNANNKLTKVDVVAIRNLWGEINPRHGLIEQAKRIIANSYGVSFTTVHKVINGHTWKHLLEDE